MTISQGTFQPPECELIVPLTFPGALTTPAKIMRIERFAGSAVGSAVIRYPTLYAGQTSSGFGQEARLRINNTVVFRGTLGTVPFNVGVSEDEVELVLFDDKWGMQAHVIGEYGTGSVDAGESGFVDVGFEVIFNKDGRPNKDPSSYEFNTGSTAVFWTLRDIMSFLFNEYVDADVARISLSSLDSNFDNIPSHLNLVGQNALKAVDTVARLAGQSWGLEPKQTHSEYIAVKPGGNTLRQIKLFPTQGGKKITEADEWCVEEFRCGGTVLNARDVHQARSSFIVKETTLTNTGATPMLTRLTTFSDKVFGARFVSNLSNYEVNELGKNLSSGSPAKRWLSSLVTRLNTTGSGYVTAAELAASPALQMNPRLEIPIWLSTSGTLATAQLVKGGYELDHENGMIDFQNTVDLLSNAGVSTPTTITNWSTVGIWITAAVVLETPEVFETDSASNYLPKPFVVLIDKPDLVPEKRFNSILPDLSSSNYNATTTLAATEEAYIDVSDKLEEVVDASLASMPKIETPMSMRFPFFPYEIQIGDGIQILGRDTVATGDEAVTAIRMDVHSNFKVQVDATNLTAAVDNSRFIDANVYRQQVIHRSRIGELKIKSQNRIRKPLGSTGSIDLSTWAFGDSSSGSTVTIYKGKLIVDGRGMYDVAQRSLTITGGTSVSPHWIIVRASRSNPSDAVIVYQASPPDPANSTYYEAPLRTVYLNGATATVLFRWHIGSNIYIAAAI